MYELGNRRIVGTLMADLDNTVCMHVCTYVCEYIYSMFIMQYARVYTA